MINEREYIKLECSEGFGLAEGDEAYISLAEAILETCREDYIFCSKLIKEYGDVHFVYPQSRFDPYSVIKEMRHKYLGGMNASDYIREIEEYIYNHPLIHNPELVIEHLRGEVA